MGVVNISKCIKKVMARNTGEWLYRFYCSETDCQRTFAIRRGQIERHHGLCGVHARLATEKRRMGYEENEVVRVGTLYSLFIANVEKGTGTGESVRNILSLEAFEKLTKERRCVYCSSRLPWFESYSCFLDKRDPTKGYAADNLVPCCYLCKETKKNNFSHLEMLLIGNTINRVLSLRVQRFDNRQVTCYQ